MKPTITISDLQKTACATLNPHLFEKEPAKKKSKYNNTKVEVDGQEFDSKREAARFKELRILLKQGKIAFLATQVEYQLNIGGSHDLKYIADFQYMDVATGKTVVEDTKGFRTKEYRKKKRLMKQVHGVDILET